MPGMGLLKSLGVILAMENPSPFHNFDRQGRAMK